MARKVKKMSNKRYFDYSLLFVVIFMAGFGLIMIYSTSSYTAQMEYGNSEYYFIKQLEFVILGMAAMYAMYRIDYHIWRKLAPVIFVVSIILVLALIPFGTEVNGAKRWLRFGGIGIQPADVSKLALIIILASTLSVSGKDSKSFWHVAGVFVATAVVEAALVGFVSNNMSSALIIGGIGFVMVFVAYPGYKFFVAVAAVAVASVTVIYIRLKSMLGTEVVSDDFRLRRVLVWLQPENYAQGIGYQTVQALYAIGSGGLFGKGLGKSLQKLGYVPESQNDMIFSIICEELGLFGAVCIILVFAVMLWRIVHIAQNAPDLFGTMLAAGVFAHIAIQVILNIAVVTNTIPNTGVSLPFISYGGSSAVILLSEMGLVLNISSKIRLER
jgi:cell division protein FtsW